MKLKLIFGHITFVIFCENERLHFSAEIWPDKPFYNIFLSSQLGQLIRHTNENEISFEANFDSEYL